MTEFDRAGEESTGTDRSIDARDARALAQYLTVLEDVGRARGAEDLYLVISESGSEYLVDARLGACECPDFEYRDVRCKHLRRVAFAIGETSLPDGVDVDPQLGVHVDTDPKVAATDGGIIEAGDGGEILDESDEDSDDGRPEDCRCDEDDLEVACWPCYRVGFDFEDAVDTDTEGSA